MLIEPLATFEDAVERTRKASCAGTDWFYPPLCTAYEPWMPEGKKPQVPASTFQLPATHRAVVDDSRGNEYAELAIAIVGLMVGLRLIPGGWVHFYRAAIKPGTLNDLVVLDAEIEHVLTVLDGFWTSSSPQVRKCMFGAIHWLLFVQSYAHDFERFSGQYIVLDTCFKVHADLHGAPRISHSMRPAFLAKCYSIPLPGWAALDPDGTCALSRLRNEYFHEGRYGGEPIGFAHPQDHPSITVDLTAFNTRLLLGILGVRCGYVKSPSDTRQMHSLGLP